VDSDKSIVKKLMEAWDRMHQFDFVGIQAEEKKERKKVK